MTTESLHKIAEHLFKELQREDKDAAVFLRENHEFYSSTNIATTYTASIVSDKIINSCCCVQSESNDLKLAVETVLKEYRLAVSQADATPVEEMHE